SLFGETRRRGPQPGANLEASMTLTLREAAIGGSRTVKVRRRVHCKKCEGTGAKAGSSRIACPMCNGRGTVISKTGFFQMQTACPTCRGQGTIVKSPCESCRGEGLVGETRDVEVQLPPGLDNGMRLRVRGQGEHGPAGAPAGDLFVRIEVKADSLFERDGVDLHCRMPIGFAQAALGAHVEAPTLEGKHPLEIPRGTQSGDTVRLRHRGMPDPQGGGRGDLFIHLFVEVPKKLGKRQEELLRELAELEKTHVDPQRKSFFERIVDYFRVDERPEDGAKQS
ncbi:MAG TPA: DnaJ C-terminal domain-containing protein, partial [Planctomycetia bacterium]|nr:DnaJ C-terminal domain-containing protein [Planctomycetia bacterium]